MLHLHLFNLFKDVLEGSFTIDQKVSIIKRSDMIASVASISNEAKDTDATQGRRIRSGYMAFMTELTNIMQKVRKTEDSIEELFKEQGGYAEYLEKDFAEQTKLITTPLVGPSPNEDSDEEKEEDNGLGFNMNEYFKKFNQYNLSQNSNNDDDD